MTPHPAPKWFETTWFTIVALILLPPIGLFFLWRYRSWPPKLKWQITGIATVWFIFVNLSGSSTETSVKQGVNATSHSARATPKATAPKPTPTRIPPRVVTSQTESAAIENDPVTNKKIPLNFTAPVWDIPSLVNKSRNETDAALGVPEQPHFDDKPGEYSDNYSMWAKDETTLFIRFAADNNTIVEIQLNFLPDEGHDYPSSREAVMLAGNLKMRDSRYNLDFSEANKDSKVKSYSSVEAVLQ